jgi:hypothetical protein
VFGEVLSKFFVYVSLWHIKVVDNIFGHNKFLGFQEIYEFIESRRFSFDWHVVCTSIHPIKNSLLGENRPGKAIYPPLSVLGRTLESRKECKKAPKGFSESFN